MKQRLSSGLGDPGRYVAWNPMISNLITRTHFNRFSGKHYYDLLVDGQSLEQIALEQNPNYFRPGLVPTLLNWLRDEGQRQSVWNRIIPAANDDPIRCPVLMCDEDIDFHCDLMIVEIIKHESEIHWTKMGVGQTMADDPPFDFLDIDWAPVWSPLRFDMSNYIEIVDRFRLYLNDDSNAVYPPMAGETVTERQYSAHP